MVPLSKYVKKYQVTVNDADFTKKLKLSAAFNYFQEIASLHADNLGIGFNEIGPKYNVTWVLTRMKVEILKYPIWDQEIVVETWPQIPKRFHFERDFYIKDLNNNILVKATSMWVLIDINTRELRSSDIIAINYPEIITERAIESNLGKIRPTGEKELIYKRIIGCSDIDMNEHLNNSKYVDFIMDCFSMDTLRKYHPCSIQVNYVNESLAGDEISLYKYVDNTETGKVYVEGVDEKTNSQKFISEIVIQKL